VQVYIEGLTKHVSLNGKIGTIIRIENERYVVKIPGSEETSLKPEHLVVLAVRPPPSQSKKRKRIDVRELHLLARSTPMQPSAKRIKPCPTWD
jgi:hypothetical protein